MTTTDTPAPDLAQVKQRQQKMWASGDFHAVAIQIQPVAETLCQAMDLQAGWRVIDVACGSGNAAIAAARCDTDVVGIDYVPSLLARRLAGDEDHAAGSPLRGVTRITKRSQGPIALEQLHTSKIDLYRRVVTIRSWSELRTTWAVWRRRPRSTEPSTSSPTGSS